LTWGGGKCGDDRRGNGYVNGNGYCNGNGNGNECWELSALKR